MFKLRIPNLLFTLAAGFSSHIVPMAGESAPRVAGTAMHFTRRPGQKLEYATDSYGIEYQRCKRGVIIRCSHRISELSRAERKAIWSKAVAVN